MKKMFIVLFFTSLNLAYAEGLDCSVNGRSFGQNLELSLLAHSGISTRYDYRTFYIRAAQAGSEWCRKMSNKAINRGRVMIPAVEERDEYYCIKSANVPQRRGAEIQSTFKFCSKQRDCQFIYRTPQRTYNVECAFIE